MSALHLDTNFNYKIDGYVRLARALEPLDLVWLEIDLYDPAGSGADPPLGPHADRVARIDLRPAQCSGRISRTSRSITRSSTWRGTAFSNW